MKESGSTVPCLHFRDKLLQLGLGLGSRLWCLRLLHRLCLCPFQEEGREEVEGIGKKRGGGRERRGGGRRLASGGKKLSTLI